MSTISDETTVKWLRESAERYFVAWGRDNVSGGYLNHAADVIERLGSVVAVARFWAQAEWNTPDVDALNAARVESGLPEIGAEETALLRALQSVPTTI